MATILFIVLACTGIVRANASTYDVATAIVCIIIGHTFMFMNETCTELQ